MQSYTFLSSSWGPRETMDSIMFNSVAAVLLRLYKSSR